MTTEATATPDDGAPAPDDDKIKDIPVEVSERDPDPAARGATPAAEPEAPAAEGSDEAPAEPEGEGAEGAPEARKPERLPEWAQKEIAKKAFEARENARKVKELQDRLAAYEKGDTPPPASSPTAADTATATQNAPEGGYRSQADFDAAVKAEADRRAAAERAQQEAKAFQTRLDDTWNKGLEAYGSEDFNTVAANLQQVGFTPFVDQNGQIVNTELMQLVLETENPAKVLYDLGSNPAKAADIMSLPPTRRAVAIAKMDVVPPAPKPEPTPLSKAPRPVQTVEGSSRPSSEPQDSDDDETWFKKRDEQIRRRHAAA